MWIQIEVNRDEVARIARAHSVQRLRVFGSVLADTFDPARSDIDVFVDFQPGARDPFDNYFGLKEELEELFGRPVDLVVSDAVRNPHFKDRAFAEAVDLYAA